MTKKFIIGNLICFGLMFFLLIPDTLKLVKYPSWIVIIIGLVCGVLGQIIIAPYKKQIKMEKETTEVKQPNFIADGKFYFVRCPKCKKENWAPAVADGICVWCGFDGNSLITQTTKPQPNATK